MKIKSKLTLLKKLTILIIMLYSCGTNTGKEKFGKFVNYWMNRELILPIDTLWINVNSTNFYIKNNRNFKGYKIVTRIDGDCSACIEELNRWKGMVLNYRNMPNLRFNIYVYSNNIELFKNINQQTIKFPHPLIYDRQDDFMMKNKLRCDKLLNTFYWIIRIGLFSLEIQY